MTELIYLTDAYQKTLNSEVTGVVKKGNGWFLTLASTIFYPRGGGQPADLGIITGPQGKARVTNVVMKGKEVIHECQITGVIKVNDRVNCNLDWDHRYYNMRNHTAGHAVHEAVMKIVPGITPLMASHDSNAYIEYHGSVTQDKKDRIEKETNEIIGRNLTITSEFVTLTQLKSKVSVLPEHLPVNKPLRIVTIEGYDPVPDGGTQVHTTAEIGTVTIDNIHNFGDRVRVYYGIRKSEQITKKEESAFTVQQFTGLLLEVQQKAMQAISSSDTEPELLRLQVLGNKSDLAALTRKIKYIPDADVKQAGILANEVKNSIIAKLTEYSNTREKQPDSGINFDPTMPGILPPYGHLHLVTQAIAEITGIFKRIGFTRVRHPEIDWDWYAFESLNMPENHPARDEWETFFIHSPQSADVKNHERGRIVLTPHTSNGQVREMEKGIFPIRMINIAKCYRRQSDISHTPMFHQFEGLYVDRQVSIAHLKGVIDYFVKQFYGPDRQIRLRPFHFQFTEPSFEIDVTCGLCHGSGILNKNSACRLCKSGWLELGGAGMVHPAVLRNGAVDTGKYNGFAFGWGVERTFMMKAGTSIDDIRLLYSNDIRFLEQF